MTHAGNRWFYEQESKLPRNPCWGRLVYLNKKAYESKFRAYGKSVSPFNVANLGRCLGG